MTVNNGDWWWIQCRCGNREEITLYRGRWYCTRCGRLKPHFDLLADGTWHPLAEADKQRSLWAEIERQIA